MQRTYRRQHYTVAYLLLGYASIGAPVFLIVLAVGMLGILWLVTYIGTILPAILGLAILGNGLAFMIGVVYLGYALLTGKPQQSIAPTHIVRIVEMPPTLAPAAQAPIRPEVSPPRMAPPVNHRVVTPQPGKDTREPVYLPGSKRIAGWQYSDGSIRWDSTQTESPVVRVPKMQVGWQQEVASRGPRTWGR